QALLVGVAALVDIEPERPRRAVLVVAVPNREHDAEPRDVGLVGAAFGDRPRQRAFADTVRGAPAAHTPDRATGTDRIAVAGLEVCAADAVGHRPFSPSSPSAGSRSGRAGRAP